MQRQHESHILLLQIALLISGYINRDRIQKQLAIVLLDRKTDVEFLLTSRDL